MAAQFYKVELIKMEKTIDLRETILDFGSDSLRVFGGKFQGGINLQQSIEEIHSLLEFLISQNIRYENFLEIGSASGGNVFLFNYFFNFKQIYIVDNNRHKKHRLRKNILKDLSYKEYIGNSQSLDAKNFIQNTNLLFDIIFIDADHSYDGVKKDIENYKPFLKSSGWLIFHDTYICDGVKKAFNELKYDKSLKFINEFVSNSGPKLGIGLFQNIE